MCFKQLFCTAMRIPSFELLSSNSPDSLLYKSSIDLDPDEIASDFVNLRFNLSLCV